MTEFMAKSLPLALAFIMFALGLKLTLEDFRRVFQRPSAVALGLVAQCVLLPATAFGLIWLFRLEGGAAVGLMILAACPGGVTAAMITDLARGDTCLSLSLTALTSLLSFVTVPLVVGFSLMWFMDAPGAVGFPVAQAAASLFLITLLPVAMGIAVNRSGALSAGGKRFVHRLATLVFLVVVVATFVAEWPSIETHFAVLGPAVLLLNLLTMLTGAVIGTLAGLPTRGRIALAVECGVQNSALGITVAVSLLGTPAFAVPSVLYAFLMNLSALALIGARQFAPDVGERPVGRA